MNFYNKENIFLKQSQNKVIIKQKRKLFHRSFSQLQTCSSFSQSRNQDKKWTLLFCMRLFCPRRKNTVLSKPKWNIKQRLYCHGSCFKHFFSQLSFPLRKFLRGLSKVQHLYFMHNWCSIFFLSENSCYCYILFFLF